MGVEHTVTYGNSNEYLSVSSGAKSSPMHPADS